MDVLQQCVLKLVDTHCYAVLALLNYRQFAVLEGFLNFHSNISRFQLWPLDEEISLVQ